MLVQGTKPVRYSGGSEAQRTRVELYSVDSFILVYSGARYVHNVGDRFGECMRIGEDIREGLAAFSVEELAT